MINGTALALIIFLALLGALALRVPVALAMFICGSLGYIVVAGAMPYLAYIKTTPYFLFSNYTLSVIPLFILMGALAENSGLSKALFTFINAVIGQRRGGIAMATIGACTFFGAVCGSSVATTATMGRAALPELRRYGYSPRLASGTIAVGGTLGILIPPSVILVIYAISTEQNIAHLFMAALIPGLLASVFYIMTIAVLVRRDPVMGPAGPRCSAAERRRAMQGAWPVLLIAVVVIGGIYGQVFTPTEGAAVGVGVTLLVAILRRSLSWQGLRTALLQTAETTAMIFLILLGAEVFNAFLALSHMPETAAAAIAGKGLPPYAVLGVLLMFYILLGAVMDELAMILLTLPVFFPLVMALDFGMPPADLAIWFGILVLIVVGIGLTAPPIGLNVFVVSAIAKDIPMKETYRGVVPFLLADSLRLALLITFPGLALGLVHWLT